MKLTCTVDTGKATAAIQGIKAALSGNLEAAAQAGAQVFIEAAQQAVPVLSGELQGSITAEIVESSDSHIVIAVAPHEPYAGVIEGAKDDSRRAKKPHPHPFMQEAFDTAKDNARQAIIDALKAALATR